MEFPAWLRRAVDDALEGLARADLARAVATLSERYRSERVDRTPHLADDLLARAYLATRLPATYAAVREVMHKLVAMRPDFSPMSLLDVGAGPGTALWAAADCWPSLKKGVLIEGSAPIRKLGEMLGKLSPVGQVTWQTADITKTIGDPDRSDLVCLTYVLSEVGAKSRRKLIEDIWTQTGDLLLVVEPGTPRGWERIIDVRSRLIELGAHLIAPCPHRLPCPITAPDWCHFSRRVARSRMHRLAKLADVPWEDEKFSYIAVSRRAGSAVDARVIASPQTGRGHIRLKLCTTGGSLTEQTFSRRDGISFKVARRSDWGDAL